MVVNTIKISVITTPYMQTNINKFSMILYTHHINENT